MTGTDTQVDWVNRIKPAQRRIVVLLVDDQAIIGEAVRRMLAGESDIDFHYCNDPTQSVAMANQLRPTVILQDLVMPQMDGLTLAKFFRANPKTRDVPLIVLSTKEEPRTKAEAFALGANDYLVKLPDRIELIARIRHHSRGYINLLERNEAYQALLGSQKQLAEQINQAAQYVQTLLPAPIQQDGLCVDWRFIPSSSLGGDVFGYHWLNDDHFVLYLLDVCGHGVGAALLAVSVMNVLRSRSMPQVDFLDPSQVLASLNDNFRMQEHNNMFFTIWYGVYQKSSRTLRWAGGGHPNPLLLHPAVDGQLLHMQPLDIDGPLIGVMPDLTYVNCECHVPPGAAFYLFSDGVFEIPCPDGSMWNMSEFRHYLQSLADNKDTSRMDQLLAHVRKLQGCDQMHDDFSIVEARF